MIMIVILISFLVSLFLPQYSHAIIQGSETVISVESAITFPAADNDNTMLGFGWFKSGFALEDDLTTCTFDAVYPVSGIVNLNGGILHLHQDLIFHNVTTIASLGTIQGFDHFIEFCSSITWFPPDPATFEDVKMIFRSDVSITSTMTFKGHCVLIGDGNRINLSGDGAFVIDQDALFELRNIEIAGVTDTNIRCVDDSGTILLDHARVVFLGNYTFDKGKLFFVDQVDLVGSATFSYESSQTSTIEAYSVLRV